MHWFRLTPGTRCGRPAAIASPGHGEDPWACDVLRGARLPARRGGCRHDFREVETGFGANPRLLGCERFVGWFDHDARDATKMKFSEKPHVGHKRHPGTAASTSGGAGP